MGDACYDSRTVMLSPSEIDEGEKLFSILLGQFTRKKECSKQSLGFALSTRFTCLLEMILATCIQVLSFNARFSGHSPNRDPFYLNHSPLFTAKSSMHLAASASSQEFRRSHGQRSRSRGEGVEEVLQEAQLRPSSGLLGHISAKNQDHGANTARF